MEDLVKKFGSINTMFITDNTSLENIVQKYADIVEMTWNQHSQWINITRQSKNWWDNKC